MLLHAVLALEAFDPAGRVDQPLCPGVERVTVRADFDMDFGQCRTSFECITACAGYYAPAVLRMDISFHWIDCRLSAYPQQSIMPRPFKQLLPQKVTTQARFVTIQTRGSGDALAA